MDQFFSRAPNVENAVAAPQYGSKRVPRGSAKTALLFKKLSFVFYALALVLISSSESICAAEEYHWKIGHVRPEGTAIDNDTNWLVEKIFKETDGKINITIYPSSQLGGYTVAQEKTSFGGIDMYIGPFGTMTDRRLLLPNIPYLVTNWSKAKEVFSPDSLLLKKMTELLEAQNIKILGGWPVYFGGIVLTEEPLQPTDPDISKDMIIRVPPMRSFELTAEALGYTPYPITWLYAKDGLVTGMVKGIMGGGAEGYEGLGSLAKYYFAAKDHFEYWFIYMNLDLWKNLSEEEKDIVEGAAREMEKRRWEIAEAEETASIKRLSSQGTKIIELTDDQVNSIKSKISATVWPLLKNDIGIIFDQIVSSVNTDKSKP